MTMAGDTVGRRWFLRMVGGAALSVVTMGAQALFGASPASAQRSCCWLIHGHNSWCPLTCVELGHSFRCWTCFGKLCKCCECTTGSDCWSQVTLCSYEVGCCT